MAENIDRGEQSEIAAEFLQFVALQEDSRIKLADLCSVPSYASLLAVSNKYGYVVYATHQGFGFAYTTAVASAFKNTAKRQIGTLPNKKTFAVSHGVIHFVRLSADNLTLIIGVDSRSVLLYDVPDIVKAADGANVQPYKEHIFNDAESIRDIRPNPETFGEVIAVLLSNGTLKSMKLDGSVSDMKQSNVSAISWSPRGKQLACGLRSGDIVFITPKGTQKGTLSKHPVLENVKVHELLWFENSVYVIVYSTDDGDITIAVVLQESKLNPNRLLGCLLVLRCQQFRKLVLTLHRLHPQRPPSDAPQDAPQDAQERYVVDCDRFFAWWSWKYRPSQMDEF
ncbi:hypothetical protein SeLEV6574_g01575 [Synchytrium endobioticum]|uniref:Nucleoporin Nup159/Nup146 N-terminal domain-containing protein n=1 Tax=Synchytrium endobioticum TaxID=286115 RepID=A0A507DC71_9FUNG|nr:hypothetical protein SeLEV6574_g01575 [Synchytrium endobioticum]